MITMKKNFKIGKMVALLAGVSVLFCSCQNEAQTAIIDFDEQSETTAQSEAETIENAEAGLEQEMQEEVSEEENMSEYDMPESYPYFEVENPGYSYFADPVVKDKQDSGKKVSLTLVDEERNNITDDEEWFMENNLEKPEIPYCDENYWYESLGEDAYETYILTLSDINTNIPVETLDFSQFRYSEIYEKSDYDYIAQRIIYAKAEDGIVYVATGHNTYSKSCPQTAYITAIDMEDGHVIWKTEPLTCNSYSFAIADDYIICGYGFTAEDDYLKIVDKNTGKVIGQEPVNSMPEYIIYDQDQLFVRTYDTNYIFTLDEICQ